MRKIIRSSLALVFLLSAIPASACTYVAMPLLHLVEIGHTDHIISFRVTGYEEVNQGFPRYMDGVVTGQWRGEIEETSIRIYGGDGLSCQPFVTASAIGQEWLLPISNVNGQLRLATATSPIAISNGIATGFISSRNCPRDLSGTADCYLITAEHISSAQSEEMTLEEFEQSLQLHSDAVAFALRICEGPSTRCEKIRPSYDPATGVLTIPSVDVQSSLFTYGVSAKMQLKEGADTTFEVTEIK